MKSSLNYTAQLISKNLVVLFTHIHSLKSIALHYLIVDKLIIKFDGRLFGLANPHQNINSLDAIRDCWLGFTAITTTYHIKFVKETPFD